VYLELAAREPRPTTTYTIPRGDRESLQQQLQARGGDELPPGPYESWRVKLSDGASQATAIMYQSGKLVIAGHAPAFDQALAIVEAVGKPVASKRPPARPATSAADEAPSENEPHIGTDEAGKGDFFGPLVTAGVYVDERTAKLLRTLSVRDSKLVGDRELRGLATNIRNVVEDDKRAVIILAPKRYNELYKQMRSEGKNLNTLLAWAHTRVIEDLIGHGLRPKFILSDQFGDKRYIESRLMVDTRLSGVPVIQMHRAEADVAVAAASILARDAFLGWLERAGRSLGLTVPKGASPKVIETGKLLVSRMGADGLKEYAKVSFKTMNQIVPGAGPVVA
jgi:ribonuclease HIII